MKKDDYKNDAHRSKQTHSVEELGSGASSRSKLSRRQFLTCMAALGAGATFSPVSLSAQTSRSPAKADSVGSTGVNRKIALEEHYISPSTLDYMRQKMSTIFSGDYEKIMLLLSLLSDFGDRRLEAMDKAGIALSVLGSSVGVQTEKDIPLAVKRAKDENDFLAKEIQKRPTRYAGFATLPMQAPVAAADELERCVRDLGFKGTMMHGHTQGRYLDEDIFIPFWERVQELDVPVYLHPETSFVIPHSFKDRPELLYAAWGWTVETGTHALRMVFGGTFECFPKVRLILGHMGETLPYMLWRLDSRWKLFAHAFVKTLISMPPSGYIKRNIVVTTSGVFSNEPLLCAITALGEDSVMFSVDYPYESVEEAAKFMDNAPVSAKTRMKVTYQNAKRILRLAA